MILKYLKIHIILIYLNFHIKGAKSVIWPCQEIKDCNSIVINSTCILGNCVCPPGQVFSTDLTKCIQAVLYGDYCTESVQCSYMPSSAICKNGKCQCDDDYTYIRGRCKLLSPLNGTCSETIDCKFGNDRESVTCRNGKCLCADGYYQRSTDNCRRKSMDFGDKCVVDSDCDSIAEGAKCENLTCKNKNNINKNNNSYNNNNLNNGKQQQQQEQQQEQQQQQQQQKQRNSNYSLREIAVQTSFSFADLNYYPEHRSHSNISSSLSADKNKHDNEENIELSTLSPASEIEIKKYGDPCNNPGQPCENLHHSICVENFCHCKLGYYHDNGICKAELGEKADAAEYCEIGDDTGPQYNNKTSLCTCPRNFYYEPNLRSCKKAIPINGTCTSNLQCSPFGASFCKAGFPKKCHCETYAEYDEKKQLCEPKTGLGSICKNNSVNSCQIKNSVCSTDNICVCKTKYIEKDGVCLADVNTECNTNDDCAIENSVCITPNTINTKTEGNNKSSCQCKKGYVHFDDQCLKSATEYGDDCIVNEQCKPLLGELGTCQENKCGCDPKNHYNYGKCEEKRAIGEKCIRAGQCYTPDESKGTECRNQLCKCRFGYEHDPTTHICIKPKANSSSSRPSILKIITFILIGSAFFITSAAIKQAYY